MDIEFIKIKGNDYTLGTNDNLGFEDDKEGPSVKVKIEDFSISKYPVTNNDFLEFFRETGYITDAEKFGYSFVFHLLLDEDKKKEYKTLNGTPWWYEVPDASWRKPEGKGSSIESRMDHPVTHISYNDAMAFCNWANFRLPTEAEWEFAARGGDNDFIYPWGNELTEGKKFHANTFQGEFPKINTKEDGFIGTAPVTLFNENGYGLKQVIGNVWEWCLNKGKIELSKFKDNNKEYFINESKGYKSDLRALRGGSFLCHESHCNRYRIAGRNSDTADSSACNVGYRVVKLEFTNKETK